MKGHSLFQFFNKKSSILLAVIAFIAIILTVRSCRQGTIVKKHIYTIGKDSSWYSISLVGKERNLSAFSNDLLAYVSQESNLNFSLIETNAWSLLDSLNNGTFDAIFSDIRPSIVNQQKYLFSELLFKLGPVLVVPINSKASSLKDMQNKTIGVHRDTILAFNAVRESGANNFHIYIVTYDSQNKAFEALTKGYIDGVISDAIPTYTLLSGFYAGILKAVTPPLTDEGIRLVTLKTPASEFLINTFDASVDVLQENGIFDQLIDKWNLINPDRSFQRNYPSPSKEKTK